MSASRIVKAIKEGLIEAEDRVSTPEIHLTNTATGEIISLCMLPEEIRVKSGSSFRSYNIIERGEIKIPKGEQLTQIGWSGIFPNARMLLYNFLRHEFWEQPLEIIRTLTRWREAGNKIHLLITQTQINMNVYLKNFDTNYKKAMVGINYTVNFIAAKELKIMTTEEADAQKKAAQANSDFEIKRRASLKSKTGVLFGRINSIWEAAQILLGKGGDWEKIAERNGIKDPVNLDPSTWIYT